MRNANLDKGIQAKEVADINLLNSIDGSVILDTDGTIHAIGAILDGEIETKGNPARGARYNSAIKYLEFLKKKKISGMILIVSEDGSVEILDTKGIGTVDERKCI